jgi:WD40 repeat protein
MAADHATPLGTAAISSRASEEHFLELDADVGPAGGLIALADTSFRLHLYDSAALRLIAQAPMAHAGRVNCVRRARLAGSSSSAFLSASEDGHVRAWDPAQGLGRPALDLSDPSAATAVLDDDGGAAICSVAADSSGRLIAAGGEAARVLVWDVRMGARVLRIYDEVHTEACTSVSFHAGDPSQLLTGSVDGLICVLDATREPDDEELVTTVCNTGDAVARAGSFDNGAEIGSSAAPHAYCVSGSEVLTVWDLEAGTLAGRWPHICKGHLDLICAAEPGDDADEQPSSRRSVGVEYLLDCVFSPAAGRPSLSVVGGTHSGNVHLMAVSAKAGVRARPRAVLGGHRSTVRACVWAEDARRLYTIGEDGLLCCWDGAPMLAPPDEDDDEDEAHAEAEVEAGGSRTDGGAQLADVRARANANRSDAESATRAAQPARRRARGGRVSKGKLVSLLLASSDPTYVKMVTAARMAERVNWLGRVRAMRWATRPARYLY